MTKPKTVTIDGNTFAASPENIEEIQKMLNENQEWDFRKPRPKSPGCGHSDEDICDCDCHNPDCKDIIRHLVPCCFRCQNCGRRIKLKPI